MFGLIIGITNFEIDVADEHPWFVKDEQINEDAMSTQRFKLPR